MTRFSSDTAFSSSTTSDPRSTTENGQLQSSDDWELITDFGRAGRLDRIRRSDHGGCTNRRAGARRGGRRRDARCPCRRNRGGRPRACAAVGSSPPQPTTRTSSPRPVERSFDPGLALSIVRLLGSNSAGIVLRNQGSGNGVGPNESDYWPGLGQARALMNAFQQAAVTGLDLDTLVDDDLTASLLERRGSRRRRQTCTRSDRRAEARLARSARAPGCGRHCARRRVRARRTDPTGIR